MTRSTDELEDEVERTRSRVDDTVEALSEKMSPGQLIDELMQSFRGSGGSDMLSNLGRQVRDNPLPLAMVGAGLAWLIMGSGSRHDSREEEGYGTYPGGFGGPGEDQYSTTGPVSGGSAGSSAAGRATAKASEMGSGAADRARAAAEQASSFASSASDKLSSAKAGASHAAGDASGRMSAAAEDARHRVSRYGRSAKRTFLDVLEDEPLVIGALGVAVGAAIGAALPPTKTEDRYLGPTRDRALEEGREMARERVEETKEVVAAAYGSAKTEADRQGMTSTGPETVADKAERVAKAGAEAAKQEAKNKSDYNST